MKRLLFFTLLFSLGCSTKRERLNNEIIKNNGLQKIVQDKIYASEKLFSEYSDSGDTLKANMSLNELVGFVRSQDSLRMVNDSLKREIKKYKK